MPVDLIELPFVHLNRQKSILRILQAEVADQVQLLQRFNAAIIGRERLPKNYMDPFCTYCSNTAASFGGVKLKTEVFSPVFILTSFNVISTLFERLSIMARDFIGKAVPEGVISIRSTLPMGVFGLALHALAYSR